MIMGNRKFANFILDVLKGSHNKSLDDTENANKLQIYRDLETPLLLQRAYEYEY